MEKVSEAVISKVKAEAQNIIQEAEGNAREEIEKAKKQREIQLEEEKTRMLSKAEEEAARTISQATIKTRQQLAGAKTDAVNKMIDSIKSILSQSSIDKKGFLNLVKEAMDGLCRDKGRIYVSSGDISAVKSFLAGEQTLANKIIEIKEGDFSSGGVIAESADGKLRIDNTYTTRLEMLMPKLLPDISKELFETP